MKKKILYIVEGFGGGVYTFIVNLVNAMSDEFDITLAYSRRSETPLDVNSSFNKNIKIIELNNSREINLIKDMQGFLQVRKLIKEELPDILHLHSSKAGVLGRVAASSLVNRDMKVFYNPHGFSFLQENEGYIKLKFYYLIEKIMAIFPGTIITVSQSEFEIAKKLTDRIINVNNSIDIKECDELMARKKNKKNKKFKIATLARISAQKNPILFNEIALELPEFDFIWIGDGELKAEITAKNIEVTGWLDKEKAIEKLSECDVFILTSLWEGLSISLLEAMALGKPVIVNNIISNRDVIKNGSNGFIANNKDEFINQIKKLYKDKNLYSQISKSSKKYVNDNHNIRDMINKYADIYMKE